MSMIRRKITALLIEQYQAALDKHGGNVSRAAEELGVTRQAVHKAIKRYDLRRPREGRCVMVFGYDQWKTTEPVDAYREDAPECPDCGRLERDCVCPCPGCSRNPCECDHAHDMAKEEGW